MVVHIQVYGGLYKAVCVNSKLKLSNAGEQGHRYRVVLCLSEANCLGKNAVNINAFFLERVL